MHNPNPVHRNDDGWYFWDETWAFEQGPYESERDCIIALKRYILEVLDPQ